MDAGPWASKASRCPAEKSGKAHRISIASFSKKKSKGIRHLSAKFLWE